MLTNPDFGAKLVLAKLWRNKMAKDNNYYWLGRGISPSSTEDGPSEEMLEAIEKSGDLKHSLALLDEKDPQPEPVGMH